MNYAFNKEHFWHFSFSSPCMMREDISKEQLTWLNYDYEPFHEKHCNADTRANSVPEAKTSVANLDLWQLPICNYTRLYWGCDCDRNNYAMSYYLTE